MGQPRRLKQNQRLSMAQKNANDKQWYKEQADLLEAEHDNLNSANGGVSEYKRMKVNYDLFNNILNKEDFAYVCTPFGAEVGQLPADMVNRDISSGKIKAILGMEMKRPFSWKVIAVNSEATTRKETEEFNQHKQWVNDMVMMPIRQEEAIKAQQQARGRELNEQEQDQIRTQIEQAVAARTPASIRRMMQREHQDPAEVLGHQLLEYVMQKCEIKRKFNDMFKHAMISAKGVMYVGLFNGEPHAWNVNSADFCPDTDSNVQFTEDGEMASCRYHMRPSQIVALFNDELNQTEIDELYEQYHTYQTSFVADNLFAFEEFRDDENAHTIPVLHTVWRSLTKYGFLTYLDDEGVEQMMTVDENYRFNPDHGDVDIEWKWLPEVYETWKIGKDMYKKMQPLPGQVKDVDNMYNCKLPYYGAIYDNMNSKPTALMDRLKVYQYYYNIVMYRLELLLASDKGKKILMNINAVPDSAGMNLEKWQYFFESSPWAWFDPDEEGMEYSDVNTMAKVLDLSVASDIGKYIDIAEYLKKQAGESVGITPQVEGQIGPNEAVSNTRQNIIQSSHILEPYFELHNHVKKNVLQALLETAKIAYHNSSKKVLSYVLDDLSLRMLTIDEELLDNSTYGLFVSNSSKAEEAKETIRQFAHAALQNQKVELSDVISVIRQDGIVEAEETLKDAENERRKQLQAQQENLERIRNEEAKAAREFEKEKMAHELEAIVLKEEERRKTVLLGGALTGMSFNPESDRDEDGVNDFFEIAQDGLNAELEVSKQRLEEEKLAHQKQMDREKLSLERAKLEKTGSKN
jgi:hypothetical protein